MAAITGSAGSVVVVMIVMLVTVVLFFFNCREVRKIVAGELETIRSVIRVSLFERDLVYIRK